MECPKCNNILTTKKKQYAFLICCEFCYSYSTAYLPQEQNKCCNKPNLKLKKHQLGTGIQIRYQCESCGNIDNKPQNQKSLLIDRNTLPLSDKEAHTKRWEIYNSESRELWKEYNEEDRQNFFRSHNTYLRSETWEKKRKLVLKRDNHLCQSCLLRKATQVHHKSYRYRENEPLFDLISVCTFCHNTITAMDNNQDYDQIH